MRIVRTLESFPPDARPSVVALGVFDGVHLGHRAILDTAVARAHKDGGTPNNVFSLPAKTSISPNGFVVVMGAQEGGVSCVSPPEIPCFMGNFSVSNTA